MSRKPLSIWEQERKQEFDKQLKEYSTECLHQIYQIATKGLDTRTRLLANEYLIDKCFGKDYRAFTETNETKDMNINLIVKNTPKIDAESVEKEIQESEELQELITDNEQEWNPDDNWGEDVFIPHKRKKLLKGQI